MLSLQRLQHAPFHSFWMGGFEGADHINSQGQPLDPNRRNGHGARLKEDYTALKDFGIRVVRESIGWRLFEEGGAQSIQALQAQARLAAQQQMQVIWTLMHYGWPRRLDPWARPEEFIAAFAAHCQKVAQLLADVPGPAAVYQPINEISFLAWAASRTALIHPHLPAGPECGAQLKRVLVRAALGAIDAIWAVSPGARIVHTDPVIHVEPHCGAGPAACAAAASETESQFEAWDMLCGRKAPELGGAARYLDLPGINYYHNNQWEQASGARLHWHLKEPRRRPFGALATALWRRYGRPLCITETGHVGEGRGAWLDDFAAEVAACKARGIPIAGLCLYPLIDRPDWEQAGKWHHSGLWDVPGADAGDFTRQLCLPYADRLRHWQKALAIPFFLHPQPTAERPVATMTSIIVFSHLRWDFVYQRPQQLLSRLAATHPVVFVEEPMGGADHVWLERYRPCAGVEVLRMHLPGSVDGFDDAHMQSMRALLQQYLQERSIHDYLLWFYTPMALPLARGLTPRGSVYDCMDELSAFDFAPPALMAREEALFAQVDLVFTGGRSLYASKCQKHKDVHCFPSSVDQAHFGQRGIFSHPEQPGACGPRLGYYGVIDERLDLALVAALADAYPEWQVVMVGPVVKVDPASLPQRPNLHWMGQRRYDELPAFLAGWDVCLMPFALNAATRFISPTKTLEYLAAAKPVVSTPVRDVAQQYADVVSIAASSEAFVQACERVLARSLSEREAFAIQAAAVVAATSWDATVVAIQALLRRLDIPSRAQALFLSAPVPEASAVSAD